MYRISICIFLFGAVAAISVLPSRAVAQNCINPAGIEGDVLYNSDYNVPQYCNSVEWVALGRLNPLAGGSGCTGPIAVEGDIIYNADYHVLQYCDGDDWKATGMSPPPPALIGPADCPNIGDLCADGTVFAGWHPITQEHLFIPTTDQEQPSSPGTYTMNWKNASGTNDISTDSTSDGEVNHANRGGAIGDFQAFQACEDLSFGGHTDWYLPSQVELYYLWAVHETIEAGGNITNFQNSLYWSSTEFSTNVAWRQLFPSGYQSYTNKTTAHGVRCVRQ